MVGLLREKASIVLLIVSLQFLAKEDQGFAVLFGINLEIPLGLESRHLYLSNKPTFASFGHLEVPQKCPQRRATHQAICSGIQPTAQQNAVLTRFDFLELILILLVVNDVIYDTLTLMYLF